MYVFADFVKLITELIQFFQDATLLEQEKLEMARKDRVTFVEECMKKEQVMVLKLRGYEKKREQIQSDIGFKDLSFQELLRSCTAAQQEELSPLFDLLSRQVTAFRNTSECAKDMIEINLHKINSMIAKEKYEQSVAYSETGQSTVANKSFTNRTI